MGTNEGWPEAFGFSVIGSAPVMISDVEFGGSAQQAGLQIGDFIVELDGETVEQWSREEVIQRAYQARKVPPSLVVVSRIKQFSLQRGEDGGFGVTFRGNSPVFIRSVDFDTHARSAGLRSGDLLVEMNGNNVRYSTKTEILQLLKSTKGPLNLKVVAGGLAPASKSSTVQRSGRSKGRGQQNISHKKIAIRYEKARLFHHKMDYYLMGDPIKKTHLLTLLRLYSKDHDISSLGSSLNILLDSPIERRLFSDIRTFIHPSHFDQFDVLVSFDPQRPLQTASSRENSWRGSLMWTRPLGSGGVPTSPMRASMPNLSETAGRVVKVNRGSGSFGFTLSGNAPVFIRSVDRGGAAEKAGLRSGDQLLRLNGVNIRDATHSQVVRLLQGSGSHPTIMVCSPFISSSSPGHQMMGPPVATDNDVKMNIKAFKDKMEDVLVEEERKGVMKQLSKFSQHKEIPELVNSLSWVLDSPAKTVLFHYICRLLPEQAQVEFDRIAATMLAGEPTSSMSSAGPLEGEAIVPGSRLSLSSSGSSYRHSVGNGVPEGGVSGRGITGGGGAFGMGVAGRSGSPGGGVVGGGGAFGKGVVGAPSGDFAAGGTNLEDASIKSPRVGDGLSDGIKQQAAALRVEKNKESMPVLQTPLEAAASRLKDPPNASLMSTPGGVPLPPNPPPTPAGGVGGVPIPPPPPPALPGATQSHLKRVNWEKIHGGGEGTIWRELSGLEETLEFLEIEEKFANQKPKDAAAKKNNMKPAILDQKKAYNISILLGHLKLPFNKIKEAILACDDSVLSEQHLRQMEAFAPDKKECLGFARYHDNPSVLSKADKFSCEMSTIPGYKQRLRAMIFKSHFKAKVEEIKPDLEAISKASRQLQTSKNFKRVLEIVLAVGNYMNAGNRRVGGAVGFRVNFLTQLKSLKTTDNKSTLLHFVAGTVERKFPQVLEFAEDLSFTTRAARISGETLEVEVNELMQGLQDIQRDIKEISPEEEDIPGDRFREIMTKFISEADREMTELLKTYSHMKQDYASVLKFFGEDPSKMRIDDFFSTFAAFISDFDRAVKENREHREKQALIEMRNQEREKATKKKGGFKIFSRSSKNMEEEVKRELEAKVKSKKIDVKALEESRKNKAKRSLDDKPQMDFRHLLRQTNQSQTKKSPKSRNKRRSKDETDDKNLKHDPKAKVKKNTTKPYASSQAELTGSWDYIPSPPTSTIELTITEDDDNYTNNRISKAATFPKERIPPPLSSMELDEQYIQHDQRLPYSEYMYDSEDESEDLESEEEGDGDILSSSAVIDLHEQDSYTAEMEWNEGRGNWNAPNQDFDFETQF